MLSLCLTFQGTGLPVQKKLNSNVVQKVDHLFLLISKLLQFRGNIALVSLTIACNSSGLIKFKEKI